MNKTPNATGPYSTYRKADKFIITSGQLPINPKTNKIDGKTVYEQVIQILSNLETILLSENIDFRNVLKLTVYTTDISSISSINQAFEKKLKIPYPARTAIQISKLPMESLVEIEAVAVIN